MRPLNERKLKRLARLTEYVYRCEAVAAARLAQLQQTLLGEAADACAFLDGVHGEPSFLRELALARTARLHKRAERAAADHAAQLATAVQALAQSKGARALADRSARAQARGEAQRSLEEVIGNVGAEPLKSLGQGTGTS